MSEFKDMFVPGESNEEQERVSHKDVAEQQGYSPAFCEIISQLEQDDPHFKETDILRIYELLVSVKGIVTRQEDDTEGNGQGTDILNFIREYTTPDEFEDIERIFGGENSSLLHDKTVLSSILAKNG